MNHSDLSLNRIISFTIYPSMDQKEGRRKSHIVTLWVQKMCRWH